ncbi:hypothetical protein F2Q68_00015754 [Brassica cretica]|uniref:Uncharacterized protein n=2 Tax=Brassica cretica TaxID=69181 RepID=A0A8S9HR95_BRACR|nr:hypothetical protein F2Q68_00015754 [Brassica cretica]KAF3611364.1 hypothetical protein DY000_02048333 [Brassica cretica]
MVLADESGCDLHEIKAALDQRVQSNSDPPLILALISVRSTSISNRSLSLDVFQPIGASPAQLTPITIATSLLTHQFTELNSDCNIMADRKGKSICYDDDDEPILLADQADDDQIEKYRPSLSLAKP